MLSATELHAEWGDSITRLRAAAREHKAYFAAYGSDEICAGLRNRTLLLNLTTAVCAIAYAEAAGNQKLASDMTAMAERIRETIIAYHRIDKTTRALSLH
jgi:hypothetical protein